MSLLGLINLLTYAVFFWDKKAAEMRLNRFPEAGLITLVMIGGGIGAWAAMKIHHHKTKKPLFRTGVPMITILEYAALIIFFIKGGK